MVSPSKRTLLTSFRNPDGSLNYTAAKTFLENKIPDENMATLEVKQDFPYLDKDQLDVHYKVIKRQGTKVRAVIKIKMKHKDKWCPLYTRKRGDTKKTLNNRLPKEIQSALHPYEGVKIKETTIQKMDQELENLDRFIQEDTKIADDENEQCSVRELMVV